MYIQIFGKSASLVGGFFDEVLVIKYDAFKIVTAVVQLPKFLIDRCLVVKDCDYQLFVEVFA